MNLDIPDQRKVVSFYGPEKQSLVHCEELAEQIQAISKMKRGRNAAAFENLIEEVADVLIIIEQLKLIYKISDHVIQDMVYKKAARQEARIRDAH